MQKRNLTSTPIVLLLVFICCFLWGSAFPSVKIGYAMFRIASDDNASQLLFAGCRFTLAGILTVIFGSLLSRRILKPQKGSGGPILALALVQTVIQYIFFYIGLANTSGVKSSIIEASSTFFAILLAALVFHYEKLTLRKLLGCIIGFAGVVVINLAGGSLDLQLSFTGEGFILISAFSYGVSSALVKRFSQKENPVTLSGYQFILGGIVLIITGAAMGGHLSGFSPLSVLLLIYMALISSVAYSLWGILLKHNPVSRITVYGFINPVIGVILSALLLGEDNQAFTIYGLLSLILVSIGIFTVNYSGKQQHPGA